MINQSLIELEAMEFSDFQNYIKILNAHIEKQNEANKKR